MSNRTLLITFAKPDPEQLDIFQGYVASSTQIAIDVGGAVSSRFPVRHLHGGAPATIFGFATYQAASGPVFGKHGAKPVAQLPITGHPVGEIPAAFVSVLEFPSAASVDALFADPAYVAVVDVRDRALPSLNLYVTTG